MADSSNWPIVLIEIVLVFGGTLAFGWWQLRSIRRDQAEAAEKRRQAADRSESGLPDPPDPR